MFTVRMKNKFCDSNIKRFEEAGVVRFCWVHQIPLLLRVVDNLSKELLVNIDVVNVVKNIDLEVAHNPPNKTKTYSSSYIRSSNESHKIKSALQFSPKTILCNTFTKGIMKVRFGPQERSPLIGLILFYSTVRLLSI